jgi:hypothetical protein
MRKRILKTLAMLGLSVCILVGGAVSGVAEEPARKECKENEHEWKTFVEYREDCVPTDFTLEGKTFTLCPHCGKEGRKDPAAPRPFSVPCSLPFSTDRALWKDQCENLLFSSQPFL